MSDFISDVDWDHDELISLGFADSDQDPVLLKHLERNHAELIEVEGSPINQYYLPIDQAIGLEFEYTFTFKTISYTYLTCWNLGYLLECMSRV